MKFIIAIILSMVLSGSTTPSNANPESISVKSVSEDYSEAIVLLKDGSLQRWEVYEAYDDIVVLEVNGEFHEYIINID